MKESRFGDLFWGITISCACLSFPYEAVAAESCGQLEPGATYRDLNKILQCLEQKIDKMDPTLARDNTCLSSDDGPALLRGCLTSVSYSGNKVMLQIRIENKSGKLLALGGDNVQMVCGAHFSFTAQGWENSNQCSLPRLTLEDRAHLAQKGVHLEKGAGTSASYQFVTSGGPAPETVSATIALIVGEVTNQGDAKAQNGMCQEL
jgi:hypothetical protein